MGTQKLRFSSILFLVYHYLDILKGGAKVVAEGEEGGENLSRLFLVVIVWRNRDIAFKRRFRCSKPVFWN